MTNAVAVYRVPRPPLIPNFENEVPLSLQTYVTNIGNFLTDLQAQIQIVFNDLNQGRQRIAFPAQLPSFTAAALILGENPRPQPPGRIVYCEDDSGGPCLAVSDGTQWLKLTLGGPIS